ncbi:MAG TPA: hypothetical protein VFE33_08160 [Thermoanaerobaculia bacterium]|nr:hypothetical protein [Thermoanaerobaculia bacterium]
MWVIYRKADRTVVGLSADADVELDKDKALQEVVKGLAESQDVSLYDAYQVKERGKGQKLAQSLARGLVKVQDAKGGGLDLTDTTPDVSALVVTTNAKDLHPVDQVPLLQGDGQSFLVVTVQKTDDQGKPLTRKTKDNDTIWLRTSNGTLREDKDGAGNALPAEIRSVQLASGTVTFRLYSENLRRLATVHLLPTDPNQRGTSFHAEFTLPAVTGKGATG